MTYWERALRRDRFGPVRRLHQQEEHGMKRYKGRSCKHCGWYTEGRRCQWCGK